MKKLIAPIVLAVIVGCAKSETVNPNIPDLGDKVTVTWVDAKKSYPVAVAEGDNFVSIKYTSGSHALPTNRTVNFNIRQRADSTATELATQGSSTPTVSVTNGVIEKEVNGDRTVLKYHENNGEGNIIENRYVVEYNNSKVEKVGHD